VHAHVEYTVVVELGSASMCLAAMYPRDSTHVCKTQASLPP